MIRDLVMPMPGHHNALNATAAIAVAYDLGVPVERIREALAGFGGVKRRFTKTGEWNGVQIFDDYGHHPVEIAAVLRAARASTRGQVIAIVQPHRYTRLSRCSTISRAASTMPTACSWLKHTPLARHPLPVRTKNTSPPGSGHAVIATFRRSTAQKPSRR